MPRKASLPQVLLSEVVSDLMRFLEEEFSAGKSASPALCKQLENSKALILQFMTKLVQDGQTLVNTRIYFVQNKVYQKVANLKHEGSAHLNIEIVKFLKANVIQKDRSSIMYIISKDLFALVFDMYLENINKSNLLASSILALFDKIFISLAPDILQKFIRKIIGAGYDKRLFLNPEVASDF